MRDIIKVIPINREPLKFIEAVRDNFAFLENDYDYKCIEELPTFVRYKSEKVFINIYHGRLSYEIGMEIGRLGNKREQYHPHPIGLIIEFYDKEYAENYRLPTVRNPEAVKISVKELASIFKKYMGELLSGDNVVFDKLRKKSEEIVDARIEKHRLENLRKKAYASFKAKNFCEVVKLYESMQEHLTPLEEKRLEYAKKHCLTLGC